MNIGLFASNVVGSKIAKFFGDNNKPLACLVLDSKDPSGLNAKIVADSGLKPPAPVFFSDSLNDPQTLEALRALGLDLVLLAWWPYIVRKELIDIPRLGCLNFHPSLLPYNRGKNYNFWAIVEQVPFGVTLHWTSEEVDCGDIAFQSPIETTWEDTGATLYRKAQDEIVRLFQEKWPEIKLGHIPRIPQDLNRGSFRLGRELDEASKIELDATYAARSLLNLLRARTFAPHPAARFVEGAETFEVRVEIRKVGSEGYEKESGDSKPIRQLSKDDERVKAKKQIKEYWEERFEQEKHEYITQLGESASLRQASRNWIREVSQLKYSYHFTWLGRPIIQFPQDIVAVQEIIWRVRPDLIIETGIAHGGSLVFHASMLELAGGDGQVLGIDVDIRAHNRVEIEKHSVANRIILIEGSSTDDAVAQQVRELALSKQRVMLLLDSNHTHEHVLRELRLYSPLVTAGSYAVVFDTIIEDMPDGFSRDRAWGKGNNPRTAVREFLKTNDRFVIDKEIQDKLLITVAPDGYLKCVKD